MPLRVLHLNTYNHGGAARAARAVHDALLASGVDSTFLTAADLGSTGRARFTAARAADRALLRLQRSPRHPWRSTARFSAITAREINESNADVVNLHWITDGFLSIEEIGKITKPLVWSMYDIWPFAGTEHYEAAPDAHRPDHGYTKHNRPIDESGVDLDRWTWQRKLNHWHPMTMVPASTWLENQTKASALMGDWPIVRIPHIVDTTEFYPMDMWEARRNLGIDYTGPLIAFLSSGGIRDRRKGWDLLEAALRDLRRDYPHAKALIVGPHTQADDRQQQRGDLYLGTVDGTRTLRDIYSACNVIAVPSREDNLPLTAIEAQGCGRGVVGFRIGGLADIVEHLETGYLAKPFDIEDLSHGLKLALDDSARRQMWGQRAAHRSMVLWEPSTLTQRFTALLQGLAD